MEFFVPTPTADTEFFWEATKHNELKFQKCKDCGYVRWPASIACPKCHSKNFEYIISKGIGKIYSFVVYRVAFHEAFKNKIPYVVAVVELQEGPHILTNIVNCDISTLKCEMPVKVVWEKQNDFNIFRFQPLE